MTSKVRLTIWAALCCIYTTVCLKHPCDVVMLAIVIYVFRRYKDEL